MEENDRFFIRQLVEEAICSLKEELLAMRNSDESPVPEKDIYLLSLKKEQAVIAETEQIIAYHHHFKSLGIYEPEQVLLRHLHQKSGDERLLAAYQQLWINNQLFNGAEQSVETLNQEVLRYPLSKLREECLPLIQQIHQDEPQELNLSPLEGWLRGQH